MCEEAISDWLSGTKWAHWARKPLAGDASSRRYERLLFGDASVILMIAPPDICGSLSPFIAIAEHLTENDLAAPSILLCNETLGFMVIEDLGAKDFAQWTNTHPQEETLLYAAAVDVLMALGNISAPKNLPELTPEVGGKMIEIAFEWYAPDCPESLAAEISGYVVDRLAALNSKQTVLSLRDFHAENLIWRPQLTGLDRVGLLDFQDAFLAPPAYDLASLLRDARRDVSEQTTEQTLAYFAVQSGTDPKQLSSDFATLALQRNLRILGIFARLAKRDGKRSYLQLIPRVLHHLETDMRHPNLADIAPLIRSAFGDGGVS